MKPIGAPFPDALNNLRELARSPASWSWAIAVLGVEMVVKVVGGQDQQPAGDWFRSFALSAEGISDGKIWQLVTYGFLHGGWWHVALNAMFVLLVGSRIEHMAGRPAMIKATFAGIVGGGLAHLALGAEGPLLVGLSGGCVSLLLLLTTLSPDSKMMPLPVSGKSLGLGILIAELLLALLNPGLGLPGFAMIGKFLVSLGAGSWFEMGHACHFGGGIAGWAFGRWLLRPRITLQRLRRERSRREAGESR